MKQLETRPLPRGAKRELTVKIAPHMGLGEKKGNQGGGGPRGGLSRRKRFLDWVKPSVGQSLEECAIQIHGGVQSCHISFIDTHRYPKRERVITVKILTIKPKEEGKVGIASKKNLNNRKNGLKRHGRIRAWAEGRNAEAWSGGHRGEHGTSVKYSY